MFLAISTAFVVAQEKPSGFGNLSESSGKPVEAISDEMVLDNDASVAELSGNVEEIIQGELHLYADFVRVTYNDEQSDIKTLYAKDNVVVISGEDKATADEADYDLERGTIVLKGNANILQAGNTARAERAEINVDTGASTLSGRVRTVLQPTEDQE
ncbi:MAG: lipopolysaccharide transport periplasmic protein LptA [Rhodobacteraceae bacterium]|nr:lipopolysaccharide transport periplasmic protein LptA [Paracoccaceae bacterium]